MDTKELREAFNILTNYLTEDIEFDIKEDKALQTLLFFIQRYLELEKQGGVKKKDENENDLESKFQAESTNQILQVVSEQKIKGILVEFHCPDMMLSQAIGKEVEIAVPKYEKT